MPSTPQETNPASAFDALAETYDVDFTGSRTAEFLRQTVHSRLDTLVRSGDQALEFGCGTGVDAKYLSERGVNVLATDASPKMLHIAAERLSTSPNVTLAALNLNELPADAPQLNGLFDLVFANFGVMNCANDLVVLAGWLAERVRPGGYAAFAIMSRYCIWETSWHALHGEFKTAGRRWRRAPITFETDSGAITLQYPTVKQLERAFSPYFEKRKVMPLGLFLPPSDIFGVVEKRKRLYRRLSDMENTFRSSGWLANYADHYWIEFQRVES